MLIEMLEYLPYFHDFKSILDEQTNKLAMRITHYLAHVNVLVIDTVNFVHQHI